MNKIATVMRRELSSYFLSPIAYVIMAVFAFIYGLFFNFYFVTNGVANLQYTLGNMLIVLLFVTPLMTMRSLAEEKKMGTDEMLLTAPITTTQFVLGKYFALAVSLLCMLGIMLIHFFIVLLFAKPDLGPIISSMLGIILAGLTFIAIGLFTSSLSDNQIIAGLLGFGILLCFWFLTLLGESLTGKLAEIVNGLSLLKHYDDFNKGAVDTANIVFYLSILVLFIVLTIRQIEARRWR